MKVKIIIPYYGKLLYNFPFWLESCKFNKNIDFMLITDIKIDYDIPKNVKIVNMKFADLKMLIEKKLNRKILLKKPYKLCDFKPLYGLIFSEYLTDYEYWGYCDMDMIFGELEYFFKKYKLEKFDKFLKYGHLSLYRNTDKINTLFYKSENYNKIFETENTYGFDEENGINDVFYAEKLPFFDETIFADISSRVKRFCLSFSEKNYKHQLFYIEDGKIYRVFLEKGKLNFNEYIYIHYQKRYIPNNDVDVLKDRKYAISYKGFSKINGKIDLKTIKKLNLCKGKTIEFFEKYISRTKQYLKRRRCSYEKK